jgi:hypothetical protein
LTGDKEATKVTGPAVKVIHLLRGTGRDGMVIRREKATECYVTVTVHANAATFVVTVIRHARVIAHESAIPLAGISVAFDRKRSRKPRCTG